MVIVRCPQVPQMEAQKSKTANFRYHTQMILLTELKLEVESYGYSLICTTL